ncbi:MAG: hypothetical protein NC184_06035 [Roseburia sp.]|nr:hypothetical protein [Roseburia sp.]
MRSTGKKLCSVAALAATAALVGCSSGITVSFDTERPWHDTGASAAVFAYEKLGYDVAIYDTSDGTDDESRVKIASGSLVYTLEERPRTDDTAAHTYLDMAFSVTYNDSAPELDRGLTDTITSSTVFRTDSLATSRMEKTVALADRTGTDNLSYVIEADYFGTHTAKRIWTKDGTVDTMSVPQSSYNDNEMAIFLARATALSAGVSNNFYMTNIFDSFINGSFTEYTMVAAAEKSTVSVDIGDWVKDCGVQPAKADDDSVIEPRTYPISCYDVNIRTTATKHGPPYRVMYSENPFKIGEKEHKKIPVKIQYNQYSGGKVSVVTEYTLTSCAFDKLA